MVEERKYYNFTYLPNNLLVQMFETVSEDEVTGRVFIYIDGCTKPKSTWQLMPNDGYLYWHGYLNPSLPVWIDDIVIVERARRQGLGRILVRKAEERIEAFGLTNIEGIATREGAPFWQSLGYTIDKREFTFSRSLVKKVRKMPRQPLYPHVPGKKEPQFPHMPKGQQPTEKLHQRGPDGYPVGADKIMRDAYGPIPEPDQPFWSREGFIKPVKIYGWQWSTDYHSWRAYVRFPDGTETWTSPRKQTGGSLELLASTEGDPIRKFCCRQCGECAPKELLEEGRFPDRIAWLRHHYKEKHPSMWGKMSPMTIDVEGAELVSPEYRHLASWVSEPLPKDAY